jgi:hypothetical protein
MSQNNKEILKIGINLDLEPEERYQTLILNFNIPKIREKFIELYNDYAPQFFGFEKLSSFIVYLNQLRMMYLPELQYWSKIFDVPLHQVVLMQLLYEINSGCTTFIKDGVMFRTFDWPELFLKEILYQATFYKNGKPIYEGICLLGNVGLYTGKSLTQNYCLAINYRRTQNITLYTILKNFLNILKLHWPVSYLLRYCLENELEYHDVINLLTNSALVSPVYYSICGFNENPLIIQRGVSDHKYFTGRYTIQTNCDNDKLDDKESNIEFSIERWKQVEKNLDKDLKSNYKFPIIREDTIYCSIISNEQFTSNLF